MTLFWQTRFAFYGRIKKFYWTLNKPVLFAAILSYDHKPLKTWTYLPHQQKNVLKNRGLGPRTQNSFYNCAKKHRFKFLFLCGLLGQVSQSRLASSHWPEHMAILALLTPIFLLVSTQVYQRRFCSNNDSKSSNNTYLKYYYYK